jgi:hypothetical protein
MSSSDILSIIMVEDQGVTAAPMADEFCSANISRFGLAEAKLFLSLVQLSPGQFLPHFNFLRFCLSVESVTFTVVAASLPLHFSLFLSLYRFYCVLSQTLSSIVKSSFFFSAENGGQ